MVSNVGLNGNCFSTAQQTQKTKSNYVKNGALIGAGVQIASDLLVTSTGAAILGTDFKGMLKKVSESVGGNKKFAAVVALGIASSALIGAGIGKLVKNHKEKKAAQAE